MRFGTKILLLTLAITVGLGAIVVVAVRRQITTRETTRALSEINSRAVRFYERLDARQDRVNLIVQREMNDTQNKAVLEQLSTQSTPAEREKAQALLRYVFLMVLPSELDAPSFCALLDASGKVVLSVASSDEKLQSALQVEKINWQVTRVLEPAKSRRQYMWIDRRLFIAFAVPLRQTSVEDPSFAYYVGFAVTDDWLNQIMQTSDEVPSMSTWFIVENAPVAQSGNMKDLVRAGLLKNIDGNAALDESHGIQFQAGDEPFVGQYTIHEPAPGVRLVVALASSLFEALKPLRKLEGQIAGVTFLAAMLAVVAAQWLSRRLARPVEQLVAGTQRIAHGDFAHPIKVDRRDELGELARSFNDMAAGLAQRDLIKDSLGQFVDPRIADALLTNPQSLQGKRSIQTLLFSDLEKFTTLSEQLSPERLVEVLNAYLGACADAVKELNGYLDKFSGDGVVAFWGPPVEQNHAVAACKAALRMVEITRQFTDPPLRVRIGIATGEVIVGIIGSERSKKNYTAMGDIVNLASRIEGASKVYGTQILIDATTAKQLDSSIKTRRIDIVRVVGRAEPVELYEVLSGTDEGHDGRYEAAMELYRLGRWSEAREMFLKLSDAPSGAMARRCDLFIRNGAPRNWTGVWDLQSK